jgi:hypothetical protein
MDHKFRQLDDLVLHLKGLVLVRGLRAKGGADPDELEMFSAEIDRVRHRLAEFVESTAHPSVSIR